MKNTLPAHPHKSCVLYDTDLVCEVQATIGIQIAVPSRIAAMLAECGENHIIPSAFIVDERGLKQRATNWKRPARKCGRISRPLVEYFRSAVTEKCDTQIMIDIPIHEWHLVGMLCGKLGITPGQWYLACAAYNAEIEEAAIDKQLAGMAEMEPATAAE